MKVKLLRHIKSTSEESATIELTWDPSNEEDDRAAGVVATLADILEKYTEQVNGEDEDAEY
jgi:hypothetical protein